MSTSRQKRKRILRKNNEIIDWRKIDEVRTGIWRVKDFKDTSSEKVQIFLTSIEQEQKDIFKNKFIHGIKNLNINLEKNSADLQSMHVWNFVPSEKNLKVWKNIIKNDWMLFYFNGKYSIAGKILKKEKSRKTSEKIFVKKFNNKNLLILFNEFFNAILNLQIIQIYFSTQIILIPITIRIFMMSRKLDYLRIL